MHSLRAALLLFSLSLLLGADARGPVTVLIVPLEPKAGVSKDLTELLASGIANEAQRIPGFRVVTTGEVEKTLKQQTIKEGAGCDTVACVAEVAGALDAQELIMGNLGQFGSSVVLTLSRVQSRNAEVLKRVMRRVPVGKEDTLLDGMAELVSELFDVTATPGVVSVAANPQTEAGKLLRKAIQSFHDGARFVDDLLEAVKLEPDLADAHLRLACFYFQFDPARAREHFRVAARERGQLPGNRRAVLEGMEPALREPPDEKAWVAAMLKALERYPTDLDVLFHTGVAHQLTGTGDATVFYERAIERDPTFAPAWRLTIQMHWLGGRREQALDAADRCLKAAPYAVVCLTERANLNVELGRCDAVVSDARGVIANDPRSYNGYYWLAMGLVGVGSPRVGGGSVAPAHATASATHRRQS